MRNFTNKRTYAQFNNVPLHRLHVWLHTKKNSKINNQSKTTYTNPYHITQYKLKIWFKLNPTHRWIHSKWVHQTASLRQLSSIHPLHAAHVATTLYTSHRTHTNAYICIYTIRASACMRAGIYLQWRVAIKRAASCAAPDYIQRAYQDALGEINLRRSCRCIESGPRALKPLSCNRETLSHLWINASPGKLGMQAWVDPIYVSYCTRVYVGASSVQSSAAVHIILLRGAKIYKQKKYSPFMNRNKTYRIPAFHLLYWDIFFFNIWKFTILFKTGT